MNKIRYKNFGQFVREARIFKNLTAKEFINRIGRCGKKISSSYVTKIEVHGEIPRPDLICKIAEALDCDVNIMLELAKEERIANFKSYLTKKYNDALKYSIKKL